MQTFLHFINFSGILEVFWTLRRECARTLWEGTPFWGKRDQGPQVGSVSVSWTRTEEAERRDKMRKHEEDDLFMASGCDYAQSEY
jgi:hypothetical protein